MNEDLHERATRLIAAERVEGLSADEQAWLSEHLAECASCAAHAQETERALRALRAVTIPVRPTLVSATQWRVRLRAHELREQESRMRGLWFSCALSWVLGVLSAPLLWWGFQWAGRYLALPDVAWQTAFALWWIMPAAASAALLAGLRARAAKENGIQKGLRH
jgi:hypothetical protein